MSIDSPNLILVYLKHVNIKSKSAGLNEPSGIVLTKNNDALWVVSDDSKSIFQIDFNGNLQPDVTIETQNKELEGITLDARGVLYAVSEGQNKILGIANGNIIAIQKLKKMRGYKSIAKYFGNHDKNKGLEGIAAHKDSLFLLKEGGPGVLIEISKDLEVIKSHKCLDGKMGFDDNDIKSKKIDYSGICSYSASRQIFWIVSDKAKRVFLYDWEQNEVMQSYSLGYEEGGKYKEIDKAEGITYNPDNKRLYIVSDKEARLYVFELREC